MKYKINKVVEVTKEEYIEYLEEIIQYLKLDIDNIIKKYGKRITKRMNDLREYEKKYKI